MPRYSEEIKQQARDMCAQGLSQREIGRRLGVQQGTVSRWVNPESAERNREISRRWRQENLEYQRAYDRERARQWRQENPERKREMDRRWCQENPERKRENNRQWRQKNPERKREHRDNPNAIDAIPQLEAVAHHLEQALAVLKPSA